METFLSNLHTWREWNWGGIVFVLGIVPLTLMANIWLRRWANRPESVAVNPELRDLIGSPRYEVHPRPGLRFTVPDHEHVCDFARSVVIVRENDTVEVRCSVNGCGVAMVLGRDIARAFFIESVTAAQK